MLRKWKSDICGERIDDRRARSPRRSRRRRGQSGSRRSARTITNSSACRTARCGQAGRIARDIVKRAEEPGLSQHPVPVLLSGRAGHAVLRGRLRADHRPGSTSWPPIRCGEMQPIMLARTIATLDHMLKGRLTVNVISSDFPGEVADSTFRYKRSRTRWSRSCGRPGPRTRSNYDGEVYQIQQASRPIPRGPTSKTAARCCISAAIPPMRWSCAAQHCDVYLMWPEPKDMLAERMKDVHARADAPWPHAGLRPARPHDRARHRGRGAGIRRLHRLASWMTNTAS